MLDLFIVKVITDDEFSFCNVTISHCDDEEKVEKKEKMLVASNLFFTHNVFKFRFVKSRDYVEMFISPKDYSA